MGTDHSLVRMEHIAAVRVMSAGPAPTVTLAPPAREDT
jgi:hypothetical protein